MIQRNLEYNGALTAMGILFGETIRLVDILNSDNVDERLIDEVKENKVLQINSEASRARTIREIRKRNKWAPEGFWKNFFGSSENEQRLLFFYLCLKTYRILFDLHFKVTVKRFHVDNTLPDNFYFKMAVDEISSENKTVAGWSETTLKKTFSNYRSLLRVAGLLTGDRLISPVVEPLFWEQFKNAEDIWFLEACFQSIN
tara:strand:- start:10745 stop:11344 length:600 start_codon:yes stop_codon:yes gene_type:complete